MINYHHLSKQALLCRCSRTPSILYLLKPPVLHAPFSPLGNLVMHMYDERGMLFPDQDFADLFPIQGPPAEAPARLALVTLLQFGYPRGEGLTDR